MSDKPRLLAALVIALAAGALPLWYCCGAGRCDPLPALQLPAVGTQCVEDTADMRAHHMDLLKTWRNAVVREGKRTYISKASGESYTISLTKTCMGCHTQRRSFCDRCHTYASVRVGCWDCHTDAKGG
jgi:hypothetical protein